VCVPKTLGVQIAQNYGVRLHLVGIVPARGSQSKRIASRSRHHIRLGKGSGFEFSFGQIDSYVGWHAWFIATIKDKGRRRGCASAIHRCRNVLCSWNGLLAIRNVTTSRSTTNRLRSARVNCSTIGETRRLQKSLPAFGIFRISTGCSSAAMAQAPASFVRP
jgi:hypothetical protein